MKKLLSLILLGLLCAGNGYAGVNNPGDGEELDPDALMNATGNYEWTTGNVWMVAAGADIEAAVTAAAAGDTLVLASGTYTITADIDITKAICIRGQGRGATMLTTATDSISVFHIAANNVRIADLSIDITASGTKAITLDGTAGTVLSGIVIQYGEAILNSHNGAQTALLSTDSSFSMNNFDVTGDSADDTSSILIWLVNEATAETTTTGNMLNCIGLLSSTGIVVQVRDSSATQDITLNARGLFLRGIGDSTVLQGKGSDAVVVAENCILSSPTGNELAADSSSRVTVRNSMLVHNTTSESGGGTITREGWVNTEGLVLNIGAAVTNILTAVEDNDTALITAGAAYDSAALKGGLADDNEWTGTQEYVSTTNSATLQWYAASNRWAYVEVYGATTNVIFVTPAR